jgi:hypothetical protein
MTKPPAGEYYTPQIPGANQFNNVDLNAIGSPYAWMNGHSTTDLISRMLHYQIFKAAPAQFYDLNILGMESPEPVKSDEFMYRESQYGREPIVVASAYAGGGFSAVINVTPASTEVISVDTLCVLPNNQKVTVTNINGSGNQITITAQTNQTLPALAVGDNIANLSSVEMDGANSISQYFRLNTIERYNYVQMFVKATRFGEMEMFKYVNAGTTNYIQRNREEMMDQHRIDISNAYWNGTQGEVTLANGGKAKTMGGIFPIMQAAGSYSVLTSMANLKAAVEDLAMNTQYGSWGDTKYLYATNQMLLALSEQYRNPLQRYLVGDKEAEQYFYGIQLGSIKVVFVPMQRFASNADFPTAFANRMILLDQKSIKPVVAIPERQGTTLNRESGGTLQNYVDEWVSATFSCKFHNPPGSGWIDVTP